MSFRINDYNAFLTSLFDKNNANNPSGDFYSQSQIPSQNQSQSNSPQPSSVPSAPAQTIKQEPFPVDFDFGLIQANKQNQDQLQSENPNQNSESPIILSPSFVLPENQFDVYNVNFNNKEPLDDEKEASPKTMKITPDQLTKEAMDAAAAVGSNITSRPRVKSAHNVIEQRYRNKINDKFTALQNSVPTLRIVAKRKQRLGSHNSEDEDEYIYDLNPQSDSSDDLEGLEPARKLNKGTILAKSIEYIKFLELKNEKMKQDHQDLINKAKAMGIQIDDHLLNE